MRAKGGALGALETMIASLRAIDSVRVLASLGVIASLTACGDDGTGGAGAAGGEAGAGAAGGGGFLRDECEDGSATCDANASCVDTETFYECTCNAGYEGDGETCANVDECMLLVDDCDDNAICTDGPGDYACACAPGFVGDGKACDARYADVAIGTGHVCAVRIDGSIQCFGLNSSGQLGMGTTDPVFLRPVQSGTASNYVAVTAGSAFTCGLTDAGKALCWGQNSFGQLADGTSASKTSPVFVQTDETFAMLEAGATHACGITTAGALLCWGRNNSGQIGDDSLVDRLTPFEVPTGSEATTWSTVSTGLEFTCAVRSDGALYCWGLGSSRQLGTGSAASSDVPVRETTNATDWSAVHAGTNFACALKTSGERWCWGVNTLAQAGNGTVTSILTPTIADEAAWDSLTLGDSTGCGFQGDALFCFGDGGVGQTAVAAGPQTTPAQVVSAGAALVDVAIGTRNACAIDADQKLLCWGSANRGTAGLGYDSDRSLPLLVGDGPFVDVDADSDHSCAISESGTLSCWGRNMLGQLGDGTYLTRAAPVELPGQDWVQVQTGTNFACGLQRPAAGPGVVSCWGTESAGELGNGAAGSTNVPTQVTLAEDVVEIALGQNHVCARTANERLYCWGRNTEGQLGDGTNTARDAPLRVDPTGAANFKSIAANGRFNCALRGANGALFCWGANTNRQLGLGPAAADEITTPTQVSTGWTNVATSANHTCGVKAGELFCWGRNNSGELGFGATSTTPTDVPTKVGTKSDWAFAVLGQGLFSYAVDQAGGVWSWGPNGSGQLGNGSQTTTLPPTNVLQGFGFTKLAIGNEHVCGIDAQKALHCWGTTTFAQLGAGVPFVIEPTVVVDPL